MAAQQIEFFLHPPSPVQTERFSDRTVDTTVSDRSHHTRSITKLPSVSSLLSYASEGENDTRSVLPSDLPLISLPSPSVSSSRNSILLEPEPLEMHASMDTFNHENYSSNGSQSPATAVTSPSSLSPFLGALSLVDTALTSCSAPLSPATPGHQQQQQPIFSPQVSPHPSHSQLLLLPPPTNTRRARSLSNASSVSTCSFSTNDSYNSNHTNSTAATTSASPPLLKAGSNKSQPKAKASLSNATPYVRRKRGRPPNNSLFQSTTLRSPPSFSNHSSCLQQQQQQPQQHQSHHQFIESHPPKQQQNGGGNHFTFLTPTVWNVKGKELPPAPAGSSTSSGSINAFAGSITTQNQQRSCWPATTSTSSSSPSSPPSSSSAQQSHSQQKHTIHNSATAINTTASTTTTTLDLIPTKKRGRRPKVQLAGNFCFVWRDLTAKRGANKRKLLKQQQQQQQQQQQSTSTTKAAV